MIKNNTILISIPNVWGMRNIMRSNIYEELSRDYRIILAIPEKGVDALIAEGIQRKDIISLKDPTWTPSYAFVSSILKHAQRARHPDNQDSTLIKWHKRDDNNPTAKYIKLANTIGRYANNSTLFQMYEALERKLWRSGVNPKIYTTLDDLKPAFALSTSFVAGIEWQLFAALQYRKIKTATHVLSFDNLTSRGYLPWKYFDRYFVWSDHMASDLKRLFEVPSEKIDITGTPQFDYHVQNKYVLSREATASKIGLDASMRYFVYGANHLSITPNEPALVEALIRHTALNEKLQHYQWVIRLHPLDKYERWEKLAQQFPNVVFNLPWRQSEIRTWAAPQADEIAFLGNILRYASATLCIASTIALDSAIVDTPVICLGFNPAAPQNESDFYYNVHFTDHYRIITNSKAFALVCDLDDFEIRLLEAIETPQILCKQREQLVSKIVGVVDGQAAQRLQNAIRQTIPRA